MAESLVAKPFYHDRGFSPEDRLKPTPRSLCRCAAFAFQLSRIFLANSHDGRDSRLQDFMSGSRLRGLAAAAVVLALHIVLLRLLLRGVMPPSQRSSERPLLVTVVIVAPRRKTVRRNQRRVISRTRKPRRERQVLRSQIARPISAVHSSRSHFRAPINWQKAMRVEVRSFESRAEGPPTVRFGFPKMRARARPVYRFDWDEARLHPIVIKPGGIIIHFGDHCSVNLAFPIPICHFDTKANGNLFKNMHEP